MRSNILLLLLALLSSYLSSAQIGEVVTGRKGTLIGTGNGKIDGLPELRLYKINGEDYYVITYRNSEYNTFIDLQSFGFYATPQELEFLYNFIRDGLKSEERRTLKVGESTLMTNRFLSRQVAVHVFQVGKPDTYFLLNQNWLDRLFGKK
ncbi:hypothetical protein [Robiginitalea marina]|uniref:DUF4369 domain-containing protein n=1 Tax=Robiginitalea marina TaxID=2954105 RepID=A0ABT1B052_9FLAO|nr:hypothetical protein [Robiginitalea marina]MCO5725544.1 hypothetical protein [Robiginitalea marina]